MKSLPFVLTITAMTVGFCLPRVCSAKDHPIFHRMWGNVIVATDMTPAGRKLTPPTPEHPVYYLGASLGAEFGSIPGDRLPDKKKMNLLVADVLAKQGYLYASPGVHDPSLFLVLRWIHMRQVPLWFVGYKEEYDRPYTFEVEIMRETVGKGGNLWSSPETHYCYAIIITAFDFKSAGTKHPIPCWETRITLPADAKSMAQALPTMIIAAGPGIGRESNLPFLGDADVVRRGDVTLGELQFVGYEDKTAPASKGAEPKRQ